MKFEVVILETNILCRMDDAAQAEIAATITQRLYGDFALREATGSAQCSEFINNLSDIFMVMFGYYL